jgi:hypothetical protein
MKSLWGVGLLGFCAEVSGACLDLSGHSCEAVAYACDVTTVTFRSPSNGWIAGTYTLALVVDGETRQCTIAVPDPPTSVQGTCSATGTTLSLAQICPRPAPVCNSTACSETVSSADCVANQFTMILTIGTPFGPFEAGVQPHVVGMLVLDLSLARTQLINETIAPMATTTQPNGEACGACTNASATLWLSDQ